MSAVRRWTSERTLDSPDGTTLQSMNLPPGRWYVRIRGDYHGRVSGAVYRAGTGAADDGSRAPPPPVALPTEPVWNTCNVRF